MKLYKITDAKGGPCHGGSGVWDLPRDGKPGAWRKVMGALEPCKNGLHLCEARHLSRWLCVDAIVSEAEHRGEPHAEQYEKIVVGEARLVARVGVLTPSVLRLFAIECAEKVLPIFEPERPGDDRPRKAIEAARAYLLSPTEKNRAAANAANAAARRGLTEWAGNRLLSLLATAKLEAGA